MRITESGMPIYGIPDSVYNINSLSVSADFNFEETLFVQTHGTNFGCIFADVYIGRNYGITRQSRHRGIILSPPRYSATDNGNAPHGDAQ